MYIPRVLLCGNEKTFLRELDGRNVDIVGRIRFKGAAERGNFVMPANKAAADNFSLNEGDFQIFLDGNEISADELRKILDGQADYIIIENHDEYLARFRELYALKLIERVVTVPTLLTYARDGFFSLDNAIQLFNLIHASKFARVLDFDGYFAANDYHMFPDINKKIDGIVRDVKFPALENFYGKIYPTVENCRYKHFDAIILSNERSPADFIDAIIDSDALSENILTFVRRGSDIERWLAKNQKIFAQIVKIPAINGSWCLIEKISPKKFAAYVVTHKKVSLDLPDGYKIIHAGHALSNQTFGELVDDSGENISRLNLQLNEITALYWLWKNTRQSHVGFVHYRRFFTVDGKNVLSAAEAIKILREYDIIVNECNFGCVSERDWKIMLSGKNLADNVRVSLRKFIALRQPDYLDAFDRVMNSFGVFCYEIFVTRQNIFDDYCAWLFSFIIDAAEDFLAKNSLSDDPREYRAMSFVSEHLLTVWLMKNRLRIKPLPIIFREI